MLLFTVGDVEHPPLQDQFYMLDFFATNNVSKLDCSATKQRHHTPPLTTSHWLTRFLHQSSQQPPHIASHARIIPLVLLSVSSSKHRGFGLPQPGVKAIVSKWVPQDQTSGWLALIISGLQVQQYSYDIYIYEVIQTTHFPFFACSVCVCKTVFHPHPL